MLADTLIVALSVGPLVLSLLALAGVPGGALERFALGARRPSEREHDAIADALGQLDASGRGAAARSTSSTRPTSTPSSSATSCTSTAPSSPTTTWPP